MTAKNLSTVANDLMTTCAITANHVIHAYRAGGERALSSAEARWNRALRTSRPQLKAEVARNATALQKACSGATLRGLHSTSRGAKQVVQGAVALTSAGIDLFSQGTNRFEEKTGLAVLSSLSQAARPGAQALHAMAMQIERSTAGFASKMASR